jgi:hypothetical protein
MVWVMVIIRRRLDRETRGRAVYRIINRYQYKILVVVVGIKLGEVMVGEIRKDRDRYKYKYSKYRKQLISINSKIIMMSRSRRTITRMVDDIQINTIKIYTVVK